jgi:hypothetical protein
MHFKDKIKFLVEITLYLNLIKNDNDLLVYRINYEIIFLLKFFRYLSFY